MSINNDSTRRLNNNPSSQARSSKPVMRKQNAFSFTLTSDETAHLTNEGTNVDNEIIREPKSRTVLAARAANNNECLSPYSTGLPSHFTVSNEFSIDRNARHETTSKQKHQSRPQKLSTEVKAYGELSLQISNPENELHVAQSSPKEPMGKTGDSRHDNNLSLDERAKHGIAPKLSQVIPNVFFNKLHSIEDQEDVCITNEVDMMADSRQAQTAEVLLFYGSHQSSTTKLGVDSSQGNNYNGSNSQRLPQQQSYQASMLTAIPAHKPACRSASSSPRIARSTQIRPIIDNSATNFSLYVPVSALSRKLSLQPQLQQQHSQHSDYSYNVQQTRQQLSSQQQQSTLLKNPNGFYQQHGNAAANVGMNLVVHHNLAPRKSVIGRLERSSFQAQRLSDVGVAFGQQITAKMGLKLPASQERVVEQTRWLYLRYIFVKLRQNSLPLRDLNLTKSSKARRAAALGETTATLNSRKVSCSAPPTATITAPVYTNETEPTVKCVRRRAEPYLTTINSQDLSDLASRMNATTTNMKNNEDSSSTDNEVSNSNASQPSTNRKYIMDPTINNQIFNVIVSIIRELREMKPEFYGDTIYELIGIEKFASLESLLDVQMVICREMTRSEISWCRIIALFSLFGAMSLDCVRLGAPEHVGPLLDGFIEFVERDLALWISQQGGWESFLYKYRTGFRIGPLTSAILTVSFPFIMWILLSMYK